jgi:TPR repeat protein
MIWYLDDDTEKKCLSWILEGDKYYFGHSVTKDMGKAFELYMLAAKCNNAQAQNYVGIMYELGLGTDKDIPSALHWYLNRHLRIYSMICQRYQLAADGYNADAINNLGRLYEAGDQIEQNLEVAAQFYLEAAELNHLDAMNNLGNLPSYTIIVNLTKDNATKRAEGYLKIIRKLLDGNSIVVSILNCFL